MINLYSGRRDMFLECKYYKKDELPFENDDNYRAKLLYQDIPSGYFYAKEVNAYSTEYQVIAEVFLTREENVTIMTYDDVSDLRENDLIFIDDDNKPYRVESVQKNPKKKQKQFMTDGYSFETYISLRR